MAAERDQVNRAGTPQSSAAGRATAPDATATDTHYRNDGRSSEQIRQDIRHTREAMSGTLSELERRLSPRRILNNMLDMLKDETERSRMLNVIRENPIPSAMLAIGAGWLAVDTAKGPQAVHGEKEGAGELAESAKGKLGRAKDKVTGLAGSMKERAQHAREEGQGASERAGQAAHHAQQRASAMAHRAAQGTIDAFEQHPLPLGALTAALGLVVGSLIPTSRREDELMGRASREAKEATKEAGADFTERAGHVAQAAVEGGKEAAAREAQQQDLTPEQLAERAEQTARQAGERAEEEQKQKLNEEPPPMMSG